MHVSPHDPIFVRLRVLAQDMWLALGMLGADTAELREAMKAAFPRKSMPVVEFVEGVVGLQLRADELLTTVPYGGGLVAQTREWYLFTLALYQRLLEAAILTVWVDPDEHTARSAAMARLITTGPALLDAWKPGAQPVEWVTYQDLADVTFDLAIATAAAICRDQTYKARLLLLQRATAFAMGVSTIAAEAIRSPGIMVLGGRRAASTGLRVKWLNQTTLATLLILRKMGCVMSRYERAMRKANALLAKITPW